MESIAISYQENQPADPDLWDSIFAPISIFGIDQYISDDPQNITYFLFYIVMFIKQQSLDDKTAKDILPISEFRAAVWEFISTIYESG